MMKSRFFLGLLLAIVGIMATGCAGCQSENKEQPKGDKEVAYHDYDGIVQDFTAGVTHIQALHRQTMYALNGGDYEWRNSRVILNDSITAETLGDLHVTDINDVYYYMANGPKVQYINTNVVGGTQIPWPINDIWIEDADMSNEPIKLSAEDALSRLKEFNGIIPKVRFISLRLPVGPQKCNPQWVAGDEFHALFIDAVTGKITDWCPAFPRPDESK